MIVDVKIEILSREMILYQRPYRTNSSFVSSCSRMSIPKSKKESTPGSVPLQSEKNSTKVFGV